MNRPQLQKSPRLMRDHYRRPQNPVKTRRAEQQFARQLREIGRHVGRIIEGFPPGDPAAVPTIRQILEGYADLLAPWAERTAAKMLADVDARDRDAWRRLGNEISNELHRDLQITPVGTQMRELLAEQVGLIRSIPIEAAERVHKLTLEGLENSTRAAEIKAEILRSGEVTESRAMLIARTEVARTATVLTQTRARAAGSTHYIWRTAHDHDVRPGHKAMEGKVCEWADPPAVNEGGRIMRHHPGAIWNCRCWPEILLPDAART